MRWAHSAAVRVEQNPRQQAWFVAGLTVGSVNAVSREYGLNIVPKRLIDDGLAFAAGTQAAEALKTTLVALQSNPNAELPKV
jgi:hypothetical protein